MKLHSSLVPSHTHTGAENLLGFCSSRVEIYLLQGKISTDFHSVQIRKPGWDYGLGSDIPALIRIS